MWPGSFVEEGLKLLAVDLVLPAAKCANCEAMDRRVNEQSGASWGGGRLSQNVVLSTKTGGGAKDANRQGPFAKFDQANQHPDVAPLKPHNEQPDIFPQRATSNTEMVRWDRLAANVAAT